MEKHSSSFRKSSIFADKIKRSIVHIGQKRNPRYFRSGYPKHLLSSFILGRREENTSFPFGWNRSGIFTVIQQLIFLARNNVRLPYGYLSPEVVRRRCLHLSYIVAWHKVVCSCQLWVYNLEISSMLNVCILKRDSFRLFLVERDLRTEVWFVTTLFVMSLRGHIKCSKLRIKYNDINPAVYSSSHG